MTYALIETAKLASALRQGYASVAATHAMSAALMVHASDHLTALQSKISRIGGVLVDVLEWADAQDPELRPGWVDELTAAVEDEC